jgi:uncharacterized 2Fe-2S/4Fe-4S cluster protein (DUF4445 family)
VRSEAGRPTITVHAGETVFSLAADPSRSVLAVLASSSRVFLPAACGGRGTCGTCRVTLLDDGAAPISDADRRFIGDEELAAGVRLACRLSAGAVREIVIPRSGDTAFTKTDLPVISGVADPPIVDEMVDPRIVDRNAGGRAGIGVAVDIGTTTVGCYLVDLSPGECATDRVIAARAAMNRQAVFGADVLSRISYADEGGLEELRSAVVTELDELIHSLVERGCAAADEERGYGASAAEPAAVTVAGNTTMLHLLLGVDPHGIGRAPFVPAFTDEVQLSGQELGLERCPGATVRVLPSISAYIGADTVSAVVAEDLDRSAETVLMIDVGTNGELVLAHGGTLYTCSTAAGPAFEGATISHGVGGIAGAVTSWHRHGEEFTFRTVSRAPALGLAGSGLLDVAGQLLDDGVLDESGRMIGPEEIVELGDPVLQRAYAPVLCRTDGGELAVEAAPEITVSQGDLRELQLAKAAIAAGVDVLLDRAGIGPADIARVILTGGFGQHLEVASALRIGLLPRVPPERVVTAPNAAGAGAIRALLQREALPRMREVAARAVHIELSTLSEFQDRYIDHMIFPELPRKHTQTGARAHTGDRSERS